MKEDGPSVAHTRISSSLKSLVQCKTENESLHVTSQPKTESKLTNKQQVSITDKQIGNARSTLTPTAMEKVSETKEIDSKPNNKVKVSTGINLSMTGSSQSWMDTFEITDIKDSDDEEEPIPSIKENNSLVSEYVKKESEQMSPNF